MNSSKVFPTLTYVKSMTFNPNNIVEITPKTKNYDFPYNLIIKYVYKVVTDDGNEHTLEVPFVDKEKIDNYIGN